MERKYTAKEKNFVTFFTKYGDPVLAAQMAGYANPEKQAYLIAARPHIQRAVQAARAFLAVRGVPIAVEALVSVAERGKSEAARVQAAKTILDYVGVGQQYIDVPKEPHEMTPEELSNAINKLEEVAAAKAKQITLDQESIFH